MTLQKETELPAEWKWVKLGDVCRKITDGSHNPPKGVEKSNYLMLSAKNVLNGLITYENARYLKADDFASENKRTDIQVGDVLLTIVGTIGRCAVVEELNQPFTLQRSVAVLKTDTATLLPKILMYTLQNMVSIMTNAAVGNAQKGIYLKSLKELSIPLPPLAEQERIAGILNRVDEIKSLREEAYNKATELINSIFHDMAGKYTSETELPAGWKWVKRGDV